MGTNQTLRTTSVSATTTHLYTNFVVRCRLPARAVRRVYVQRHTCGHFEHTSMLFQRQMVVRMNSNSKHQRLDSTLHHHTTTASFARLQWFCSWRRLCQRRYIRFSSEYNASSTPGDTSFCQNAECALSAHLLLLQGIHIPRSAYIAGVRWKVGGFSLNRCAHINRNGMAALGDVVVDGPCGDCLTIPAEPPDTHQSISYHRTPPQRQLTVFSSAVLRKSTTPRA